MCRLMIEFIENNESYIELQLNIFRKSHQNRTKFVAFQIVTTEFCSVFMLFHVKELEFKNNSNFY